MTWLPGFTSPYLHLLAFNVVIKGKAARGGRGAVVWEKTRGKTIVPYLISIGQQIL